MKRIISVLLTIVLMAGCASLVSAESMESRPYSMEDTVYSHEARDDIDNISDEAREDIDNISGEAREGIENISDENGTDVLEEYPRETSSESAEETDGSDTETETGDKKSEETEAGDTNSEETEAGDKKTAETGSGEEVTAEEEAEEDHPEEDPQSVPEETEEEKNGTDKSEETGSGADEKAEEGNDEENPEEVTEAEGTGTEDASRLYAQGDILQAGDREVKIAFFGDDIIRGLDGSTYGQADITVSGYVEGYFKAICDNYGFYYTGWEKKANGADLADIIMQADPGSYDYFILAAGMNDDASKYGTLDDTEDADTVMGRFYKAVNYLRRNYPDTPVIIVAPWRTADQTYEELTGLLREAAAKYNIPFITQDDNPLVLQGLMQDALPDGIHPDQSGYCMIGEWIAGKLKSIIGLKNRDKIALNDAVLKYQSLTYTGEPRTQSRTTVVTAKGGPKAVLEKGQDYTISYENNVYVGTAVMTIKGKGKYTGTLTRRYKITGAPVGKAELKYSSLPYTGKARTQSITAVVKGKVNGEWVVLKRNRDYTISYKNNINAGTAVMAIKGKGNYKGTVTKKFTITPAALKSVTLKYSSMPYTGKARTQNVTAVVKAKVDGKLVALKRNRDYTISYKNNVNAGTATMIVKGKGNYKGTLKKNFTIARLPLKSAKLKYSKMEYTGSPRTQSNTSKVYAVIDGVRTQLKKGRDYTISYKNNIYGLAMMIFKGRGNFKGTLKKTFRITADQYNTSTNSPRAGEYDRLVNNLPINTTDSTYTTFPEFTSLMTGSSVIPGIDSTHIIEMNGGHCTCSDMVVQGMCTAGDYTLLSAYCHEKQHSSVIYVLKNGQYCETVVLMRPNGEPLINHVGGLAYIDKYKTVYIAGSKENCIFSIPLDKITKNIGNQDVVKINANIALHTQKTASMLTSYGDKLYVGTFYMNDYKQATDLSTLQGYDPATGAICDMERVLPTNKGQGAAFVEKNGRLYLIVSSSYGRGNESELMVTEWNWNQYLNVVRRVRVPNMSEEIAIQNGQMYICFESAAKTYTTGGLFNLIRPLDRVISLDYNRLLP